MSDGSTGGVVDQGDRPGRHCLGDHGFDVCGFGQVALNGDRPPARCSNLGRDALGAFLIAAAPNAVAIPAPMPFDAPVTRTTFPASAFVMRRSPGP
jgi:hypothetical protein